MCEAFESYVSQTLCGQTLVLELFGEVGGISKMTLGNRFFIKVRTCPRQCNDTKGDNQAVNMMFSFYRNYAPLLTWEELNYGWECLKKAYKQRYYEVDYAFWQYFDGKTIKRLDRKGHVTHWV